MITDKKQQSGKLIGTLLRWLALSLLFVGTHALAQSAGTVTYVYTDPQGTPLAEADASGNVTATFDYTPYGTYAPQGTSAPGPTPKGPGYTGHVNDPEMNLVYMQARYYDPATGRFLSVDPIDPLAGEAFGFNRYDYGRNNPIGNVDPTGKFPGELNDPGCNAAYNCQVSGSASGSGGQTQASRNGAPIYNKGQTSSKTPTHASTSERIAKVMSQDPDVERVHLNQSLRTVTGDPNAPNIRPDVTVVKKDGSIDQIEVRSAGQTLQELQAKLATSRVGLGVSGQDIVVEPDPLPETSIGAFGAIGVVQIIFHAWVNHYLQERHDAKLTPAQREWEKACQTRGCA
ncbi:RHS repeat-associated core domain-containing protein [Dyella nitratireducens]|uniref:Teneurin-like YD-shell domain-containing protein n=1 Tax=Dyella nitratireducens TaxID=1849580 RepID=A0ABQ1FKB6_9GAMM|nr:RHS repeat-associated core domain-containing protein [Dyella nitratireducens]GGA16882.1 hypothetical protein GCM10010981_00750 [Dyella nitratireducens]GLQ44864.1 hypothetical protein GCM10007902_47140 [Dyella nitratireducens]